MKFKENKLVGGGDSLKPSYNHGFNLIEAFDNLAPWGEIRIVEDMKENNFTDKVNSLFTTHHSLKQAGATHIALCDSVGSYFRHWCAAFTLAEVLITLGIIGVVAAMTMPSVVNNVE